MKTQQITMKRTQKALQLLVITLSMNAFAQKPADVLVTINDSIYNVADFERLYTKNIDIIADESQKDVQNYFELYQKYKLRLQDAYRLQLDQTPKFVQELEMHRKQLAEKYFINTKKLDQLVEEALQRSAMEIKASHILFALDANATPADTLQAYQKALEVRNEIQKGLPFEKAAEQYSEDLSVRTNKGNLGYFSVFKMVYPFETGAYNTKVGAVSLPVRTRFGYHLIYVADKRPTPNPKNIAHILVETKDSSNTEAKQKINEIYKRLQLGADFADMALHFSDDASTRDSGGALGAYTEGAININGISDVVYNLNYKGAVSRPFFSQYGWHIIKVTDLKEKPATASLKETFLRKIKTDDRAQLLEDDLVAHLKQWYHFNVFQDSLAQLKKLPIKDSLNANATKQLKDQTILATFDQQQITAQDLLSQIYSFPNEYRFLSTDEYIVQKAFDTYSLQKLKAQYNADLEKNFSDFAQTMKDYKEGLMLFDLLEQNVWDVAAKDTLAQQNYFEIHRDKYLQPAFFTGEVYVFEKKSDAKTYHKLLKIKYNIKEEDFPMVYKYQGLFYLNDKRLPSFLTLDTLGKKVVKYNNKYYVFLVRDKKEATQPDYETVKNQVLSDYQAEVEVQFNEKLLQNAKITTNKEVLQLLEAKYNKKNLN